MYNIQLLNQNCKKETRDVTCMFPPDLCSACLTLNAKLK